MTVITGKTMFIVFLLAMQKVPSLAFRSAAKIHFKKKPKRLSPTQVADVGRMNMKFRGK